jgi:hypothetical protein
MAGCSSQQGGERSVLVLRCPPLKAYSADWQKQAAGELRALPPGSRLPRGVDYATLRARCRAYRAPR